MTQVHLPLEVPAAVMIDIAAAAEANDHVRKIRGLVVAMAVVAMGGFGDVGGQNMAKANERMKA